MNPYKAYRLILDYQRSQDFLSTVGARLKPGDILKGRVVKDLGARRFLLTVRGVQVVALSDVPLEKGGHVKMLVRQVESEHVSFELYEEQATIESFSSEQMDQVAQCAKRIGLPASEQNCQILSKMLKYGLSVSYKDFKAFQQALFQMQQLHESFDLGRMSEILAMLLNKQKQTHLHWDDINLKTFVKETLRNAMDLDLSEHDAGVLAKLDLLI